MHKLISFLVKRLGLDNSSWCLLELFYVSGTVLSTYKHCLMQLKPYELVMHYDFPHIKN